MARRKPSGPAIFIYCVIALTVVLSVLCFTLYYAGFTESKVILWTGITVFTIMYHFWVRIIMGNVTKLVRIDYRQWWFKERKFEKKLYGILRVREWRDKVLTYNPDSFLVEKNSLTDIANTMAKAETDHWINEIISVTTMFFPLLWGAFPIFFITALAAMVFDAQFILVQRHNRPKVVRLIEWKNKKSNKKEYIGNIS